LALKIVVGCFDLAKGSAEHFVVGKMSGFGFGL
jgi:hypothetical protein